MWTQLLPALRITTLLTIVTGLMYPAAITGLCQLFFQDQANARATMLIGQQFTSPQYFHPRPSNAGSSGYDGLSSGGFNDGPTSRKLIYRVTLAVKKFHEENPTFQGPVPADAVTASASGLDPDISPANAEAQAARVANNRHMTIAQLHQLITAHTSPRDFGFLGEPTVNVLGLNLALDQKR